MNSLEAKIKETEKTLDNLKSQLKEQQARTKRDYGAEILQHCKSAGFLVQFGYPPNKTNRGKIRHIGYQGMHPSVVALDYDNGTAEEFYIQELSAIEIHLDPYDNS